MKRILRITCGTALTLIMLAANAVAATTVTLTPNTTHTLPAGGNVTLTATIAGYPSDTTAIGLAVNIPIGWQYATGTEEPEIKPAAGAITTLEWAYVAIPNGATSFDFTVSYPAGINQNSTLTATAIVRHAGLTDTPLVPNVVFTPVAAPTITNTDAAGTYGTPVTAQINATSDITIDSYGATGLPTGLSVNPTSGAITGTPSAAGEFTVTLSATSAAGTTTKDISYTISKAVATITLSDTAATYNGLSHTVTVTTTPAELTVTVTYDGSTSAPINAGSYEVVATIVDPNYQATNTTTLTIGKATPTVSWGTPAAITYGTPLTSTELNATASTGGSFSYTPAIGVVLAAGNQPLNVTFSPTDTANYNANTASVSLSVNKATLSVTAQPASRTYGSSNPEFYPSYTGWVNGDSVTVLTGDPLLASDANNVSPVGAYDITVTIGTLEAANYNFAFSKGTLDITKATLTVTADGCTKMLGLENPQFTAQITGYRNSETASVINGSAELTTVATAASPVGNYPITAAIGTLAAQNYDFTFVNGTLTILLGYHSADVDQNWKINLFELTRVIDLYNTMDGAVRTGAYHSQLATEDGFAPGIGAITYYHLADENFDGMLDLVELTRVIQLFNTVESNLRTGAYHLDPESEDGFAPGP